jgi:hypothetical protein
LLTQHLLPLEHAGTRFHVIAHSHGGSVVLEALRQAIRTQIRLQHLRSVCTVGTPYLQYEALGIGSRLMYMLLATVAALAICVMQFASYWAHRGLLWEYGEIVALWVLPAMWIGILTISAYTTTLVLLRIKAGRTLRIRQQLEEQISATFGERWLSLFSHADEAINGLQQTLGAHPNIVPRPEREHRNARIRPIAFVQNVVRMLLARIADQFIWWRVTTVLQGTDIVGWQMHSVRRAPAGQQEVCILPEAIDAELNETANQQAAVTLAKVRQALGVALTGNETGGFFTAIGGALSFDELIHTSYFQNSHIKELITAHIRNCPDFERSTITDAPAGPLTKAARSAFPILEATAAGVGVSLLALLLLTAGSVYVQGVSPYASITAPTGFKAAISHDAGFGFAYPASLKADKPNVGLKARLFLGGGSQGGARNILFTVSNEQASTHLKKTNAKLRAGRPATLDNDDLDAIADTVVRPIPDTYTSWHEVQRDHRTLGRTQAILVEGAIPNFLLWDSFPLATDPNPRRQSLRSNMLIIPVIERHELVVVNLTTADRWYEEDLKTFNQILDTFHLIR